jgi:hypothetical protein
MEAPHSDSSSAAGDDRWDRDDHRRHLEERAHGGAHAGHRVNMWCAHTMNDMNPSQVTEYTSAR